LKIGSENGLFSTNNGRFDGKNGRLLNFLSAFEMTATQNGSFSEVP